MNFSNLIPPPISYELLCLILEDLENDPASLCAVSLASSTFRPEAQRVLLKNVTSLQKHTAHLKFLQTIAASPTRLALLVRAYSKFHCGASETADVRMMLTELRPSTVEGLEAMGNLKRLELPSFVVASFITHVTASMLRGCTFRLERLEWRYTDASDSEIIGTFLPRQGNIKHLALMCFPLASLTPLRYNPETTCHQLISLTGDLNTLKGLLPGRNITVLGLIPEGTASRSEDLSHLALSLKKIKTLSLVDYTFGTDELNRVLQYFSCVIILDLLIFDHNQFFQHVNTLYKLSGLRVLILSAVTEKTATATPEHYQPMARDMFDNYSKNLLCIYIGTCQKTFLQYTRSQDFVQEVSKSEVRKFWLLE